jgi:hypothetical protein
MALRKFGPGAAENVVTDFLRGKCRSGFWDTCIAADADDLNCREWPANMRKERLNSSGNCYACRCIDVLLAGIDFFRFCRVKKNGRRKQRQSPEIHLHELNAFVLPELKFHNI